MPHPILTTHLAWKSGTWCKFKSAKCAEHGALKTKDGKVVGIYHGASSDPVTQLPVAPSVTVVWEDGTNMRMLTTFKGKKLIDEFGEMVNYDPSAPTNVITFAPEACEGLEAITDTKELPASRSGLHVDDPNHKLRLARKVAGADEHAAKVKADLDKAKAEAAKPAKG